MKKIKRLVISVLCTVPLLWVSCEDIVPGDDLIAPIIMQGSSSNATRTSITLTGSFQGISNEVKEIGVVYSTSSGFPEDASVRKKVEGELKNSVSITLEDLTPNMQYYYYWFVSSGPTEVKSDTEMFRTESTSAPQFGVAVVDSLDENVIRVKTTIKEIGNKCLLECGFEYRKKIDGAKFMPAECDEVPTNDSLGYSVILTELDANTEYEIRPYAKNSDTEDATNGSIEGYGESISVKTLDKVSPVVETKDVINVGISAATLVGVVTSLPVDTSKVEEKGFCLSSVNNTPTVYDSTLVVTGATELKKDYIYQLSNLEYNTTYYVRAYAKNTVNGSERVGYGSTMQFTTSQMITPDVSFGYTDDSTGESFFTEMTSSSAKCYATLNNMETSVLKERGFIWSEDNRNIELEEARGKNHVVTAEGTNSIFTATIEGLSEEKWYYVRAYAIYQSGDITNIGYSETRDAYTSSREYSEFRDVKNIEEESTPFKLAISSGITKKGDGDIIEYGILWHSSYDGSLENCVGHKAAQSENIDSFKVVIDNLQPGDGYHIRAYVKMNFNNEEIVEYSGSWYYNTRQINATKFYDITFDNEKMTPSSIPVSVVVEEFGDGEVVEAGFIWGYNYDMTLETCLAKQAVESSDYKNMNIVATGLESGRETVFRAYMTMKYNDINTTYYSNTRGVYINNLKELDFKYLDRETTYNSISLSTGLSNVEDVVILEKGFLWNEGDTYPTMEQHTGKLVSTDEGTESFSGIITGLKPDRNYSVVAYAKYTFQGVENVSYGNSYTVHTNALEEPNFRYINAEVLGISSIKLNGGIIKNSDINIKEKGFLMKKGTDYVDMNNYDEKIAIPDTTLYNMTTTVNGLEPSTQYQFSLYAVLEYEGEEYPFVRGSWTYYTRSLDMDIKQTTVNNTSTEITVQFNTEIITDEYEEIGLYYTDNNELTNEEVENKISSTMAEDGTLKVTLTNLKEYTTYYYGAYIKMNGKYYYGYRGWQFTTKKKPSIGDIESPGINN